MTFTTTWPTWQAKKWTDLNLFPVDTAQYIARHANISDSQTILNDPLYFVEKVVCKNMKRITRRDERYLEKKGVTLVLLNQRNT